MVLVMIRPLLKLAGILSLTWTLLLVGACSEGPPDYSAFVVDLENGGEVEASDESLRGLAAVTVRVGFVPAAVPARLFGEHLQVVQAMSSIQFVYGPNRQNDMEQGVAVVSQGLRFGSMSITRSVDVAGTAVDLWVTPIGTRQYGWEACGVHYRFSAVERSEVEELEAIEQLLKACRIQEERLP